MASFPKIIKQKGGLQMIIENEKISKIIKDLDLDIPKEWVENKMKRDNGKYHMTITSHKDYKKNMIIPNCVEYSVLGYGFQNDVYFLVVHYPTGLNMCQKYNYKQDFHITLAFKTKDDHTIRKGWLQVVKPYTRGIRKVMNKIGTKEDIELVRYFVTDKLKKEYYNFLYRNDYQQELIEEINNDTIEIKKEFVNKFNNYYIHENLVKRIRINNFSKIDNQLYGSGIVSSKHINFLKYHEIDTIINLMEVSTSSIKTHFNYFHIPIDDRKATTVE